MAGCSLKRDSFTTLSLYTTSRFVLFTRDKLFLFILCVSLLSAFRTFIIPLQGDAITYDRLASNLLYGKYYLTEHPSSISPVMPILIALFKSAANPLLGLSIAKAFQMLLAVLGFRFVYLFLVSQAFKKQIAMSIVVLTACNAHSVSTFSSLYPEAVLFFAFWGLMFYVNKEKTLANLLKVLLLFLVLVLTRYLYAILGLVIVHYLYSLIKESDKSVGYKAMTYCLIASLPAIFWAKYVFNIEASNLSEISYFNRFKEDNLVLYNLKAGLGLIKHYEVYRVNGIPAFVSLFVPITGLRSFPLSLLLISGFILGYLSHKIKGAIKRLFLTIVLVMTGFIVAGTGFSRYWLILLPGYLLGFYYLASRLNISNNRWITIVKLACMIYVINELRLDWMILQKYL